MKLYKKENNYKWYFLLGDRKQQIKITLSIEPKRNEKFKSVNLAISKDTQEVSSI